LLEPLLDLDLVAFELVAFDLLDPPDLDLLDRERFDDPAEFEVERFFV
jgi:hypothetical protein